MNLPGSERLRSALLPRRRRASRLRGVFAALLAGALWPAPTYASGFEDTLAEIISWVALIIVPIVLLSVFWIVHILPEKIAEKKRHPQAKAIQVLCLLSLAFGGLLWPLAWLWAYTKPVGYKLAYGTDVAEEHEHGEERPAADKRGQA
jgi:drug/metabolite transporter (DMT)-like permease